ncbi:hypothetical protein G4G28_05620 [Massilia sp. Dwa41.01b]|uniref:hypothetical protein n=1 Tax=unclassified Massilia TaxID=2609279 RepID=UPI0015FEE296|nr:MULTISPECIES: hypothetical protein [unclassified Massilia]QNA88098.1 hypothetical protein G4G28_05620 [Massilia sp. Dwa41.01b]QNA99008.1 hypothetical protein G4G31_09340 [Massilia sp. Se16.2.3]
MRLPPFAHALRRFISRLLSRLPRWLWPLGLCGALAACGGGVAIGIGYSDYDDDEPDHPGWPVTAARRATAVCS